MTENDIKLRMRQRADFVFDGLLDRLARLAFEVTGCPALEEFDSKFRNQLQAALAEYRSSAIDRMVRDDEARLLATISRFADAITREQ